ncbi:MAG: NAD(P)H-quinone oxidoreductase [Proteobacteria bacterium]|nr:NAD(P)H-quinone oxidoreductase [Pseudomonadota bacterium]
MAELPQQMQFVDMTAPGAPDVLVPATGPLPAPKPGEVLVKVAAAGVNRPDVIQRQGNYPAPPGASPILGLEIAGTAVALGDSVTDWKLGDTLCALVTGGGYAEYCAAPAPQCLPVPQGFSMIEAGALPETFYTVWANVFVRGHLQPGETILIHGGSSGIGTTAIQLAHAFGARVIATAGSDEKCAACRTLGADVALNYRTEDFVKRAKELTQGKGVELVLDMVGGDYLQRNVSALAVEGRLVQIAFLKPSKVEFDFMPMMLKRLTLTGSTLRARSVADKAEIARALREKVWPLLDQGKIKPVIHATFPLAEAAKAHALMESSAHIGKIVLTVP